ncbi:hypothetical protein LXL04_011875 [Taraxacum kok-saghyz]
MIIAATTPSAIYRFCDSITAHRCTNAKPPAHSPIENRFTGLVPMLLTCSCTSARGHLGSGSELLHKVLWWDYYWKDFHTNNLYRVLFYGSKVMQKKIGQQRYNGHSWIKKKLGQQYGHQWRWFGQIYWFWTKIVKFFINRVHTCCLLMREFFCKVLHTKFIYRVLFPGNKVKRKQNLQQGHSGLFHGQNCWGKNVRWQLLCMGLIWHQLAVKQGQYGLKLGQRIKKCNVWRKRNFSNLYSLFCGIFSFFPLSIPFNNNSPSFFISIFSLSLSLSLSPPFPPSDLSS